MVFGAENDTPVMKDSEFRMLCDLVRARSGLHFGPDSRFLVEKRVGRRIRELEIGDFASYYYFLTHGSNGEQELAELIDILTTNETFFFRELNQLRALIEEIIPELMTRRRVGSGPIKIWSAGCSSGEEPYSIVMLALEAGLIPSRDFHVYASDICRPMLQKARRGSYREASFRSTDPALRAKYFEAKDGLYRISDEIKKHVDFMHLNLMESSRLAVLNTMDVILCRNVIIYFDLETKRKVIELFYSKLQPGGYLLLGHSESLINLSNAFDLRHLKHDLVYRKPAVGEVARDPWHLAAAAAIARSDRPKGGA